MLRDLEAITNVSFASAGIRLRVTGWEEVPPGFGRPQALINPLVDECDLFIGLLRRRWGTATGENESGFIEEFERAVARRQATGSEPEIALYFAVLSQGELDDAGPELTKVLNFRKRIEAERIALYSSFTSSGDLASKVGSLLTGYLIKRFAARQAVSVPEGAIGEGSITEPAPSSDQVTGTDGGELDAAGLQITATLDSLRELVLGHRPDVHLDRDRLQLLGTALGRNNETLGTHLVNSLYRRREELALINAESMCWFRTLLKDIGCSSNIAQRVVPGWAVFDPKEDTVVRLLLEYAKSGQGVGNGALRSLQRLKLRPASLWPQSLRCVTRDDALVQDDAALIAIESIMEWVEILNRHPGQGPALDYLLQDIDSSDTGTVSAVESLLGRILDSDALNERSAKVIKSARRALNGDVDDLAEILGYSSDDNAQWRLVLRHMDRLSVGRLNRLASQGFNRPAKLGAINAGLEARVLAESTVSVLLERDDAEVVDLIVSSVAGDPEGAMALIKLIRGSDRKSTSAETEARLMAIAAEPDTLRHEATAAYPLKAWEALTYAVLDEMVDEAREVLRTNGAGLRARIESSGVDDQGILDFVAQDQCRAAANALSRQQAPTADDVELLLRWFVWQAASGYLPGSVWRVLERIATEETVPSIAATLRGEVAVLGFRECVEYLDTRLGPAIADAVAEGDADEYLQEEVRRWRMRQPERTINELRESLYADDDAVRIAAARALTSRLDRDQVSELLVEYPKVEGQFWYNVIALFDEELYAPTPRG